VDSALPKNDFLSKSDPIAVVYVREEETGSFSLAGQTELIK
jgi:hypothetical protein